MPLTSPALLTDLYELTMLAVYRRHGKDDRAVFELFIRDLPPGWGYFLANGIEDALDFIMGLKFTGPELAYLRARRLFPSAFLDFLARFRFRGDVYAVAEGTPVFPGEPLLRVTARRTQAQLLESALLNIVNYQTLVASKASRIVNAAARGRATVVEFGLRRAPASAAAMAASRAACLAGCAGTSNVAAGRAYGLPIVGTMAHSLVMSFSSELEAFRAYARTFPRQPVLLIDTYDTLRGAANAAIVAREMAARGLQLGGVRLDSGPLAELSRHVRRFLDRRGHAAVKIIVSNDLNEYKIADLVRARAPIDVYGVGTEMVAGKPVAALPGVYKLVEDTAGGRCKRSPGKMSRPWAKQVFRQTGADGCWQRDLVLRAGADGDGEPLLSLAIKAGRRVRRRPDLAGARELCRAAVARLPAALRSVNVRAPYPVAWNLPPAVVGR